MNEEWREQDGGESPEAPAGSGGPNSSPVRAVMWLVTIAAGVVFASMFARDALTSAVLFLLILLALVMTHEAGHFFTAKAFGIRVHEFGFGFPPRIWGKRRGETEYTVNWLPIGGFVRLEGEEDPTGPRSFASQAPWKRLIVLASGAVVNLLLPIALFTAALMIPHEVPEGRAVISEVQPGTPAEEAGLQSGDVILAIGGRDSANVVEASRFVRLHQGDTVEFTVRRDGEVMQVPVLSRWAPPVEQGPTGISIAPEVVAPDGLPFTVTVALAPWEAFPQAIQQSWDTMILARNEIASWFQGAGGPQFAGPVGIAQTTGEVARSSGTTVGAVGPLLELAALLSLNLGIINLLPLPMLDGGRILFLGIEVVRGGKRIAPEREAVVHLVGFVAFMALAIAITFADIGRIVSGDSILR